VRDLAPGATEERLQWYEVVAHGALLIDDQRHRYILIPKSHDEGAWTSSLDSNDIINTIEKRIEDP